jgi:hypothetical protein
VSCPHIFRVIARGVYEGPVRRVPLALDAEGIAAHGADRPRDGPSPAQTARPRPSPADLRQKRNFTIFCRGEAGPRGAQRGVVRGQDEVVVAGGAAPDLEAVSRGVRRGLEQTLLH